MGLAALEAWCGTIEVGEMCLKDAVGDILKIQFHSCTQIADPFRSCTDCLCNALPDVDQNLMDRLQRVNSSLHSQISRLQNIRNTIEETGILADRARSRVESTEQLIEIASRELEKAKMAAANVVSDS